MVTMPCINVWCCRINASCWTPWHPQTRDPWLQEVPVICNQTNSLILDSLMNIERSAVNWHVHTALWPAVQDSLTDPLCDSRQTAKRSLTNISELLISNASSMVHELACIGGCIHPSVLESRISGLTVQPCPWPSSGKCILFIVIGTVIFFHYKSTLHRYLGIYIPEWGKLFLPAQCGKE